jgi:hypothetical protein
MIIEGHVLLGNIWHTEDIMAQHDPKEDKKKLLNRLIFIIQKDIKLFRTLTTISFATREAQSTGNVPNSYQENQHKNKLESGEIIKLHHGLVWCDRLCHFW